MPPRTASLLAKVRRACLAQPDATERPSHGAPAWFVGARRCFAMWADDHHGDGRLALWCAAPREAQRMLVDADPERYFVPPYVGTQGWIGVRLDRGAPWPIIVGAIERAHQTRAGRR